MEEVQKLLGRPFTLYGEVIRGDQRGRTLGFPTANLEVKNELVPALGVYACKLEVRGTLYTAVTNVGMRPTFKSEARLSVETHILDYFGEIYGEPLQVYFYKKIRGEMKFDGPESLKLQISKDIAQTKTHFGVR